MPKLSQFKLLTSLTLVAVLSVVTMAFFPSSQDAGLQATVFSGATITTTTQSATVACNQGQGHIGRKTLVVWNSPNSGGVVTVTAELRDEASAPNFTSGYLAVGAVATNTASGDTAVATDAAGRFCQVSAVSASTSTITVTLRRE